MSDIIQHAKELLDGATPAPWEHYKDHGIVCLASGGMAIATDINPGDAQLIAAAPEHTEALAEETWEYSFQTKYADGWETACDDVTELDQWWPDKSEAEEAAASAYDPYIDRPIRLIRRRASPPEVIQ